MKAMRAKDRIEFPDGRVMTMGEALDRGLLILSESTDGAHMARIPGTDRAWRVTSSLYKSRMGQVVVSVASARPPYQNPSEVKDRRICLRDTESGSLYTKVTFNSRAEATAFAAELDGVFEVVEA